MKSKIAKILNLTVVAAILLAVASCAGKSEKKKFLSHIQIGLRE